MEEQETGFLPEEWLEEPEDTGEEPEESYIPKTIPWPEIAGLWLPVFAGLAAEGRFTFAAEAFTEEEKLGWTNNPNAVDLWAQFFHAEVKVQEAGEENTAGTDECQRLIQYLLDKHPELEVLRGKVLRTKLAVPGSSRQLSGRG